MVWVSTFYFLLFTFYLKLTLFPRQLLFLVFLAAWGLLLSGCGGRPPALVKDGQKPEKNGREDLLKTACELFHQARDLGHFRDALHLVNGSLERASDRPSFHLDQDQRDRLVQALGLSEDEVEEIEAASFRPLDAHHLECCYLLREAAHTLEQAELSPLQQAEVCFAWTMRHVALFEGDEELVPPRFVLQRGLGTALERGLLFLALAHQFNLDGCVVTLPDLARQPPRRWLGVLVEKEPEADVYLFDARLGRPVPGPGNKGVATLAQVRRQPELLLPGWTTDKEPPQLEISLACPLSALAPRLKYLEDILMPQDQVKLAVTQPLVQRWRAACGDELGPWKAQAQSKEGPSPAPVRALRRFLPSQEGGVDVGKRYVMFKTKLIPYFALLRNYSQMKLADQLAGPARDFLMKTSEDLFTRFALAPRDFLARGQPEQAVKRLDLMRTVLDDLDFATTSDDKDFHRRVAAWRERINKAHRAAQQEGSAKNQFQALLYEDQFLFSLTQGSEEFGPGKFVKKMPTFIVGTAVKEPLGQRVLYLLAMCSQERAERLEAFAAGLKSGAGDRDNERQRAAKGARAAWLNTAKSWHRFLERHGLTNGRLNLRLAQIADGDIVSSFELWQQLFEDCQATFHAGLLLAHAQEHAGQVKQARATLQKLAGDIDALAQHAPFQDGLAAFLDKTRHLLLPPLRAQLEGLQRQFGPGGTFAALKETVAWRLQPGRGKE